MINNFFKKELWNRRNLIWEFSKSELKIKYRNSALGFLWSFLEPLLLLTVLFFVFTHLFKNEIEHFALYLLLGLILWNTFSRGTSFGVISILSRGGILSAINLPKEIMPISSAITAFLMFFFELAAFAVFLIVFQFVPPTSAIIFPYLAVLLFSLTLGVALPLSVLNVHFRDVQFIWSVVVNAGFFTVPIFYTLNIFPDYIKNIILLNPMAQIINMSHDVVLYDIIPRSQDMAYTTISTIVIFFIGYGIFKLFERKVVEEL